MTNWKRWFVGASVLLWSVLIDVPAAAAQVQIKPMEFTADQAFVLEMMWPAPNFFELEFDAVPQNITMYLERLDDDGSWRAEKLFTHEVTDSDVSLMIDLDYPLAFSFREELDEPRINKYGLSAYTYPSELKNTAEDSRYGFAAHWTDTEVSLDSGKYIIGYSALIDVSQMSSYYEFLTNFNYDQPDTSYPEDVKEMYAITMELIEQ